MYYICIIREENNMLIYKMDDISIMTLSRKEIPNYFFIK